MSIREFFRAAAGLFLVLMVWSVSSALLVSPAAAQAGTEFPGTVVSVDPAAGKFAVKKEGGGTRFTFVANDKTKFEGTGLKGLADLKKGDSITVIYATAGSQYLAHRVTRK